MVGDAFEMHLPNRRIFSANFELKKVKKVLQLEKLKLFKTLVNSTQYTV